MTEPSPTSSPRTLTAVVAREIEQARVESRAILHDLWSQASEQRHYDKAAWSALAAHVDTLGRYAQVPAPPSAVRGVARRVGMAVLSVMSVIALALLASSTVHTPPSNARVLVSDTRREFVPPPYAADDSALRATFTREVSYAEARALGYHLERECQRTGCWIQDGRSFIGSLLERVHLLPRQPSRWDEDGRWLW